MQAKPYPDTPWDGPLRIVFMGTPDFAVPAIRALSEKEQLVAVVCQPDRQCGRGRKLEQPPVKLESERQGVEVLQPCKLNEPGFHERLEDLKPDLIVVAAFGKILREKTLSLPKFGCMNIHASLLPKYRGAAPINWAIIRGEGQTGVTIMRMDEGMDTGDMLLQKKISIEPEETAGNLFYRLADLGAEAILEAVNLLRQGKLNPVKQEESQATLAPMMKREDGLLDWEMRPRHIVNFVRGMHPWPGAFTRYGELTVKLHKVQKADLVNVIVDHKPGTILESGDRLIVATGKGPVEIVEAQLPGKRRLAAQEMLRGFSMPVGTHFVS